MLGQIFGAELEFPVRVVIALVVIAALLGLTVVLVRRMGAGARTVAPRGRGAPRLALMDSIAVDQRRRLILVRRDDMEHLLLVGGAADVVVEKDIVRREAAAPREAAQREIPPREALPREGAQRRPLAAPATPSLSAGAVAGALAAPPPAAAAPADEASPALEDEPVPGAAAGTDLAPPDSVIARPAAEPPRGREPKIHEPKRPLLGRRPLVRADGRLSGQSLGVPVSTDAVKSALATPPAPRPEAPRLAPLAGDTDRKPAPALIAPRPASPLAALGLAPAEPKRDAGTPPAARTTGQAPAAPAAREAADSPRADATPAPRLDLSGDRPAAPAGPAPERREPRLTLSDLLSDGLAEDGGTEADTAAAAPADDLPRPTADDRVPLAVPPQRQRREPLLPFERTARPDARPRKAGAGPVGAPAASPVATPLAAPAPGPAGGAHPPRPREFAFRGAEPGARAAPVIEPTWRKGGDGAGEPRGTAPAVRGPLRGEPNARVEPTLRPEEPAPTADPAPVIPPAGEVPASRSDSIEAISLAAAAIAATAPVALAGVERDEEPAGAPEAPVAAPEPAPLATPVVEPVTGAVTTEEAAAAGDSAPEQPAVDPFDELDAEMANLLGRSSAQGR